MTVLTIPEQEAILRQFLEITGASDETDALDTLNRNIWNLDMAASNYFATHQPQEQGIPEDQPVERDSSSRTTQRRNGSRGSSSHRSTRRGSRGRDTQSAATGDIEAVRRVFDMATSFVASTLGVFAEASGDVLPLVAAERFVADMTELVGDDCASFMPETYETALHRALFFRKPLLVYLHSADHPDSAGFCRKVFKDQRIVDLTRDRIFLWGGDINYEDGYRASVSLKSPTFPFLAMLFVEGTVRNMKIRLHARIEGPIGRSSLSDQLNDLCDRLEAQVVARDVQRNESFQRQRLREEQDMALEQSLREDQRKEREREEKRKAEEEKIRREQEEAEAKERSLDTKRAAITEEPEKSSDTADIRIKLPNGTTVARRFERAQSLRVLFDYLDVHIADNDHAIENYSLNMNFPRKSYTRENEDLTIEEAELFPRAALFLQDLDA